MPIYEYECKLCGNRFEFLVLPTVKDAPVCPQCQGTDLEKLLSGFAMSTTELTKSRVTKARAQRAGSKDFKDKQVAEAEHIQEHVREYMPEPPKKKPK